MKIERVRLLVGAQRVGLSEVALQFQSLAVVNERGRRWRSTSTMSPRRNPRRPGPRSECLRDGHVERAATHGLPEGSPAKGLALGGEDAPTAVHPLKRSVALAMTIATTYDLCFIAASLFKVEWTVVRKSDSVRRCPQNQHTIVPNHVDQNS